MNPRYPVYIISKGRWRDGLRLTSRALEKMNVPYTIVVEPYEYENYAAVINPQKIVILPQSYHDIFDPCCDLKPGEPQGSGPARNFCWEDAISKGFARHWILDDNIRAFHRRNNNKFIICADGTCFRVMEDFTERYRNVALSGPNYFMFVPRKRYTKPLVINTRLYSCILIRNDLPYRWRGRYNEDVDLSLRCLKAGYGTIQFNVFTQQKTPTLKMKGGNTDTIYRGGTLAKSKMICLLHPDVARLTWKFHRWHHEVDYRPFKANKLLPRLDLNLSEQPDEYGMNLRPLRSRL